MELAKTLSMVGKVRTVLVSVTVTVALSGLRFSRPAASLAFLSAILCSRSRGTARSTTRFAPLIRWLAAVVERAAAEIKVGVMWHFGSGCCCLFGTTHEAV